MREKRMEELRIQREKEAQENLKRQEEIAKARGEEAVNMRQKHI